jgi:hypothetical protein
MPYIKTKFLASFHPFIAEIFPLKKLPDKWVTEEGVAPEWAPRLHVRYKLVSTICVPLKDLDDGGAQALLVEASKIRDGEFRSTSNNPFKVGGTHHGRYQLPGLVVAFQRLLLLVLDEQGCALHVCRRS